MLLRNPTRIIKLRLVIFTYSVLNLPVVTPTIQRLHELYQPTRGHLCHVEPQTQVIGVAGTAASSSRNTVYAHFTLPGRSGGLMKLFHGLSWGKNVERGEGMKVAVVLT